MVVRCPHAQWDRFRKSAERSLLMHPSLSSNGRAERAAHGLTFPLKISYVPPIRLFATAKRSDEQLQHQPAGASRRASALDPAAPTTVQLDTRYGSNLAKKGHR